MKRNTPGNFGLVTIILHWLVGISIIFLLTLGWLMVNLEDVPQSLHNALYTLHKSIGATLLVLVAARVIWYLLEVRPMPVAPMPGWQLLLSHLLHRLLLVAMVVMVLSGWLLSESSKYPLVWFWLFTMPDLLPINDFVHDLAETVHSFSAWVTAILVGVHVLAALWHHFFDRDQTLYRMLGQFHRTESSSESKPSEQTTAE